jgi:hypothetical protein
VQRARGSTEFALIILGGAHYLADNLDRLSGGEAEYVRVATKGWRGTVAAGAVIAGG